jgi:hypothetical protein
MTERGHVHDGELEQYSAGVLDLERIIALEVHLSRCQECREVLKQDSPKK